jgi:hypothetical protein
MNACQYFMPLPCAVGEFQRRILYKQAVCLQPDGGKCEPITESFINKRRGRPARKHAADLLHMPAGAACLFFIRCNLPPAASGPNCPLFCDIGLR